MPSNNKLRHSVIALIYASGMAGCDSARNNAAPPSIPKEATIETKSATLPQPASVPLSPTATASTTPTVADRMLALEGEGLRVFAVPIGSANPIPFGIPEADAMKMLTTANGAPPLSQGKNIDCGATSATWKNGLTVWFTKGQFAGWSVGKSDHKLTTASGIGLGSSRADLDAAYDTKVSTSSLGAEFNAGGVAGLLASLRADARVTNLWAGVACLGR